MPAAHCARCSMKPNKRTGRAAACGALRFLPVGDINRNLIALSIKNHTIAGAFPDKFHFAAPMHALLEVADADKTILFWCISWNNYVPHIIRLLIMFEFRCTIRIIARRTWYWALSWIIPCDDMIVRICMCPGSIMICIMSFNGSSSIIANFRIHPIAVLKCPFHFTRFTYVSAIGGFARIRSPFSAVGAAAAFERRSIHVRFFSIRFRAISLANQKIFQIFFRKSLLRVQIPPRAALVIGIDEMVFHFQIHAEIRREYRAVRSELIQHGIRLFPYPFKPVNYNIEDCLPARNIYVFYKISFLSCLLFG